MAGPIGYEPPVNPYAAMPIETPKFTGINPMPAQAAALQTMQPVDQQIQKSEQYDTQAAQAAQFQRLLSQGTAGMQSYISDVAKENPELATHFTQELQTMAPFMQTMKGKDLNDAVFNMYDSWNGRYNGAKMGKVMADPFSTDSDIFGAYAANGGNPDKLMGAYAGIKKTDAMMPYYQAKAGEAIAHAGYLEARPNLQKEIEQMRADAKIRAARIRTSASGNKKNYQITLAGTLKSKEEVEQKIADLEKKLVGLDPMEANFDGYNTLMHQYRAERLRLQGWINKAMENGARPNEWVDVDAPDGITAPSAPGTPGAPAPAPAGPPPELRSDSSPDAIKRHLSTLKPGKVPTDQDVQMAIQALKAMGR